MTTSYLQSDSIAPLSIETFRDLGNFIHSKIGIKMPDAKRNMVESRLHKRLINLNMRSYKEYCNYLFSPQGIERELPEFINQITTNKTDFFREPDHFKFLMERALPDIVSSLKNSGRNKISLWCAACSRGHEPYTTAMILSEFSRKNPRAALTFSILATDISTQVLDVAKKAVYSHDEIEPVPIELRKKYILRAKNRKKDLVRISPELRKMVQFRWINLVSSDLKIREPMDVIFCRNVMIYFDKKTQEKLIRNLCSHLKYRGYLFVGHSEVLNCHNTPLEPMGHAIYHKTSMD
ncbi:MAG: chemotaxis protein CheR [Desulfamplus sp.]|nr:chemotaxis protein CheR [Desulfamplus sp.]